MYTCFYFNTGYVVLQNCDAITQGIVAFPYALLLEAFVPYLANSQPKVHSYVFTYDLVAIVSNYLLFCIL